jgi:5-hydroxyisourate hydrolase-like protein (transthyretin family)
LKWESVEGAEYYELYRNGKIVYSGLINEYIDVSLKPGTKYSYALKAINLTGSSSSVSVATSTLKDKPNVVSSIKATATENQAMITWAKSTDATYYIVKLGSKVMYTGPKNYYKHTGLNANKAYTYRVTAVNSGGLSNETEILVKTKAIQTITKIMTSKSVYKQNDTIVITINVLDKRNKAVVASVKTTITDPQGKTKTLIGKTDKSGAVKLTVKTSKSTKLGDYKLKTTTMFTSKQTFSNSSTTSKYTLK